MSLRKPVPKDVQERLSRDDFMLVCALSSGECKGGLQWHHATPEFGESYRRDDWWSIIPLCTWHHDHVSRKDFAQRVREILFQRRLLDGQ